jgi:hypothetical protein
MTTKPLSLDELEATDWESFGVPMVEEVRRFITIRRPADSFLREFAPNAGV